MYLTARIIYLFACCIGILMSASLFAKNYTNAEVSAGLISVEVALDEHVVSESQVVTQHTPVATFGGSVYTANVEAGPSGDKEGIDLHTVVRKGTLDSNGVWQWQAFVVEERTAYDKWHTPPSIAVDSDGYIHVAYNMHNMPWQYSVSSMPESIESFEFRGEKVSRDDLENVFIKNRSSFKTLGSADIPGNQITYPAFKINRRGELLVSYRFAAKPARKFKDRAMSSALAIYSTENKSWDAIGPKLVLDKEDYKRKWFRSARTPSAIASADGWTSYHPRPSFGPDNQMHILWFWRQGIAGAELERPCYMRTEDGNVFKTATGSELKLPVTPDQCLNPSFTQYEKFYSNGNTVSDDENVFYAVLSPVGESRQLITLDDGEWTTERTPDNASILFVDSENRLWAIADGPKLFVRESEGEDWKLEHSHDGTKLCFPSIVLDTDKTNGFLYMKNCKEPKITIFKIELFERLVR